MTTEDYVSFETAKLLKEKGFKCDTLHYYYNKDGDLYFSAWSIGAGKNEFVAPTLQMAMKWLREVHNIYIDIRRNLNIFTFRYLIQNNNRLYSYSDWTYSSYEQACEAAIEYCLENLI
jgi:hypothetical protein